MDITTPTIAYPFCHGIMHRNIGEHTLVPINNPETDANPNGLVVAHRSVSLENPNDLGE